MAKKIKFALKMKDGVEVRNLQGLQENFDLNQVTAYFIDERLETWLKDRYYDELALSVQELNINDPDLQKKLCWILEVTYIEEKTESIEKIKTRSWKLENMKSGKQKCLWNIEELMKYDNHDPIYQFSVVEDYLYFFRERTEKSISHAYRIKLNGSERSIIGKVFRTFELNFNGGNNLENQFKERIVENDIREIIGFCSIANSINGGVMG